MTTSPRRVLVADDDPEVVAVLSLHLGNEGYEVCAVSDAELVMTEAYRTQPDLLLLDAGMSTEEGRGLFASIADDPAILSIPVLYLVGGRVVGGPRAPKLPRLSVITKPVAVGEMLARVAAVLRGAAPNRPAEVETGETAVTDEAA